VVTLSDIHERREAILQIAARHGASNVRIFGSVARGQAREGSDLDLLVQLQEDRSLLDHVALMQDLEDLLGCRVEVMNDRAMHRLIRDQILAEAIPL
jgi:predicted nucleotidyltransferase